MGGGGAIIALGLAYFLGVDPSLILALLGGGPGQVQTTGVERASAPPPGDELADFVSVVLADTGPPLEVSAVQRNGETGVDVAFDAQMRFSNDLVAQISCGFRRPSEWGVTLVGSDRIVRIEEPWKPGTEGQESVIRTQDREGEEETLVLPAVDPYRCEVAAMEACVLDGANPVVPLQLSRQILCTVLALYQSAATGQPLAV